MFESTPHRRVALVALAALVALSGAAAGAPATADVSPSELDHSPASMVETTTADENVSVEFVYEGERLVLRSADEQTVKLRTNADAGSELVVVARSSGNFLKTSFATVSEDGTATATFDMSDVAAGSEFTALVREDTKTRVDGVVANATATVVHDSERLTLRPEANQTIRGEADADPGTELTVRIRGSGDDPFLKTDHVTVDEDGSFVATFNLSDVTADADFEVTIRDDSTDVYRGEGSVVEAAAPFTTEGTDTDHDDNDGSVPGFDVPAALVALLAGLALARKRRQ